MDFKPRFTREKPIPKLYDLINHNRSTYSSWLNKALSYSPFIHEIKTVDQSTNPSAPSWNNEYLPGLDIIMLYTLLTEIKPEKYIEVGSGNSTKVAFKAKSDHKLGTKIISIDPNPRAFVDEISDKIIRQPFENIDLSILSGLKENDILFIDNSHRILPNSDSMVFFLEVLPSLAKGVIVHVHDIYLPYDYPQVMCDRFYSEQYGLAICLLSNPKKFNIILPNFFISEDSELKELIAPIWNHPNLLDVERQGSSFWFVIDE